MLNKFIKRPVLSIVISLIIMLLGAIAIKQLPVTQFPVISPPKVNITAEYPGAIRHGDARAGQPDAANGAQASAGLSGLTIGICSLVE